MFKIIAIALLVLAAAHASQFDELDNFIGYGDRYYSGFPVPYAYNQPRQERVAVKKVSPYLDDGKGHLLVPASVPGLKPEVTEVEIPVQGLVSTLVSVAFGLIKKGISCIFGNIPALIVGTFTALGICQFTPICGKLSALQSLVEVQREIRSLATPERMASATEFVKSAIRKYRSLQNE